MRSQFRRFLCIFKWRDRVVQRQMSSMETPGNPTGSDVYIAGATYSPGRPDKTWEVGEKVVRAIFAAWKNLTPYNAGPPSAPKSGYAGCFFRYSREVEFFIYSGVATLMTPTHSESRADPDRQAERLLIESAPDGVPGISPTDFSPS